MYFIRGVHPAEEEIKNLFLFLKNSFFLNCYKNHIAKVFCHFFKCCVRKVHLYWQVYVQVTATATYGKNKNKLEVMVGSYVMIEIVEASKNREKEIPIYFHILKMTIRTP